MVVCSISSSEKICRKYTEENERDGGNNDHGFLLISIILKGEVCIGTRGRKRKIGKGYQIDEKQSKVNCDK